MNTDLFARATFVLDRSTVEGIAYLARRLRRSRSDLVREVLHDPVDGLVRLLERHPEGSELDPRQLALDGLEMIEEVIDGPYTMLERMAGLSDDGDGHD